MTNRNVPRRRLPAGKRALLEDCYILLVSLVLTEPKTTLRQQRLIPKLIKRLRKELEYGRK